MADAAAELPSVGRASLVLASGTIVSRILGFVGTAVLAWAIGLNNPSANAYALAQTLPQTLLLLIAGGFLSSFLVPQIVKSTTHPDGGRAFTNRLTTLGATLFLGVTVLATVGAPVLIGLFTLADENLDASGTALAIAFAYWCLPQLFFFALSSLLGEVLNARGVFGPSAWAPVVTNLVTIAGLFGFAALYGVDPAHRDPASWEPAQIALLGVLPTVGIALQALVLALAWKRAGLGWRPDFRWRGVGLGTVGRTAGWAFGMIVVNQIAGLVQVNLALTAGAEDASVNALRISWAIFVLPHSLLAVSIATPYFTRMSAHAANADLPALRGDLSAALRIVGLLVVGAGAALAAAAVPFLRLFAADGREALATTPVLLAYLLGLASFGAVFLIHRGFYALGDTRTPFLIQVIQAVVFTLLALLLVALVPGPWVAAAIALAITVAGGVQTLLAALVLRRRLASGALLGPDGRLDQGTRLGGARVVNRFVRYAVAGIPALLVGSLVALLLGAVEFGGGALLAPGTGFAMENRITAAISTGVVGVVSLLVYLGGLTAMRVPELRELRRVAARGMRRR